VRIKPVSFINALNLECICHFYFLVQADSALNKVDSKADSR
jgi:hypothetical protein